MTADKAEVGKKYLTKRGDPVTIVGTKGGEIVVKAETTGNTIVVEKDYELHPYEESKISKDAKLLLKANGKTKGGKAPKKREGTLAVVIDQFLFEGKHTVQRRSLGPFQGFYRNTVRQLEIRPLFTVQKLDSSVDRSLNDINL